MLHFPVSLMNNLNQTEFTVFHFRRTPLSDYLEITAFAVSFGSRKIPPRTPIECFVFVVLLLFFCCCFFVVVFFCFVFLLLLLLLLLFFIYIFSGPLGLLGSDI